MAPDDDPKVKKLLGESTPADLERWFSLPSFQQVEEEQAAATPPPTDDETLAIAERKAKVAAAVDPALLDAIHRRTDDNPNADAMLRFKPVLDINVDPDFGVVDEALITRVVAEPRDANVPDFQDELNECAPQALLRDLHRPESEFDKVFEIVDAAAEERLDIVAEVKSAMTTRWKLPTLENPLAESRQIWAELRAARRQHPMSYLPSLRNRRLQE